MALEARKPDQLARLDLEVDRRAVSAEPEPADAEHGRVLAVGARPRAARAPRSRARRAPVIIRTSCCGVQPPRSRFPTISPDRITVMRSPISSISSIRCVMKMTPMPFCASLRTIANKRSRVATSSAEVASSRIRILGSRNSARTMPQAWRSDSDSSSTATPRSSGRPSSSVEHLAARERASRARRNPLAPGVVAAEPNVVEHRARLGDQDLLEHGDDARASVPAGRARSGAIGSPLSSTVPASGDVDATEDLDDRRLSATVLADQRPDLPGAQLERSSRAPPASRRTPSRGGRRAGASRACLARQLPRPRGQAAGCP